MGAEKRVTVTGAPAAIESWVRTLSDPAVGGWSRGTEIERKVKSNGKRQWPICLIWSGDGLHPKTALFLQPVSECEVEVANIVPFDRTELAPGDRKAALAAFQASLIDQSTETLLVEDKSPSNELSHTVSPPALVHFIAFSRTAGKTLVHASLDLPRWYDFLIQLHRDGIQPPADLLEKALKDEGFSEDAVQQLLQVYSFADNLLSRYDAFGESE